MKLIELENEIQAGKKIRRECWDKNYYVWMKRDIANKKYLMDCEERDFPNYIEHILAEDWELYQEPKKIEFKPAMVTSGNDSRMLVYTDSESVPGFIMWLPGEAKEVQI